jgi:hypothetical protein
MLLCAGEEDVAEIVAPADADTAMPDVRDARSPKRPTPTRSEVTDRDGDGGVALAEGLVHGHMHDSHGEKDGVMMMEGDGVDIETGSARASGSNTDGWVHLARPKATERSRDETNGLKRAKTGAVSRLPRVHAVSEQSAG